MQQQRENYHLLWREYERTKQQCAQLHEEVSRLAGTADGHARELAAARGMLERSSLEKRQMEHQAFQNREYAKRLEGKVAAGASGRHVSTTHTHVDSSSHAGIPRHLATAQPLQLRRLATAQTTTTTTKTPQRHAKVRRCSVPGTFLNRSAV